MDGLRVLLAAGICGFDCFRDDVGVRGGVLVGFGRFSWWLVLSLGWVKCWAVQSVLVYLGVGVIALSFWVGVGLV